jgi:glycosyltransferase involved in cell wall biosynthesis
VRILHLADRLSDRGGAYRHLLSVLEALRGAHEQLLAVGLDDGTATVPVRVRVLPPLASRVRAPFAPDALREFRPDVVHLHNPVNPAVLEWAAAESGVGVLLTVQDHRFFCPAKGKWTRDGRVCREPMAPATCAPCFEDDGYFREIFALTEERLRAARRLHLVTLSSYMKEELVAAGVPESRVDVVPPFVQGLDPAAEPDGPPCVLFVGRLVEAKGVHDAVRAWRGSGTALPLVFAGTGPLRQELSGVHGVEVLGWVAHARLSPVFARARAMLLPSRWQEPFGLAGLEAASLGVPVVAYDSGGIREWHPGPGLVEWGDAEALGRALRVALAGGRGLPPPVGFDRPTLTRRLVGLYERLAGSQLSR